MLKLRSMMEDVAEKLFSRLLPQVEARADHCTWEYIGCCDGGTKKHTREICDSGPTGHTKCEGSCPI
jgi:hypothetical protein